jgi:hypothetical protein
MIPTNEMSAQTRDLPPHFALVFSPSFSTLPIFDGRSDAATWIKRFENITSDLGWSDQHRRSVASFKFADTARDWYDNEGKKYPDWKSFTAGLLKRFTKDTTNMAFNDLFSLHQSLEESVEDYCWRMQTLVGRTMPTMEDHSKAFLFKRGLLPHLQDATEFLDDFDDIYKRACRAQESRKIQKRSTSIGVQPPVQAVHQSAANSSSTSIQAKNEETLVIDSRNEIADLKKQVELLTKTLEERTQSKYSKPDFRPQPWKRRPFSRDTRTFRGQPICLYCHKVGHFVFQ